MYYAYTQVVAKGKNAIFPGQIGLASQPASQPADAALSACRSTHSSCLGRLWHDVACKQQPGCSSGACGVAHNGRSRKAFELAPPRRRTRPHACCCTLLPAAPCIYQLSVRL